MEGIEITNSAGSSSSKGKQIARTKIIAGAQNVDDLSLPVLAVYKQKYVSISRALDSAEAKLAKASELAVGSLHDLKIKVPAKIDPEVVTTINAELVPKFTAELKTAGDKLLHDNTTSDSTAEIVKHWTDLATNIAGFNDHSFKVFVDTFRAKVAMGDTPTMYLPMYVWKSLDRGTNFQLTKYCSNHQCQKDWQEIKRRIEIELDRARSKDISLFLVKKHVLDTSFNVISRHLFNKTIFNRNRFHKSKFGINKLINKSFDFFVENNLVVTCADKNMGLTIMDYNWYNYQVNKHLGNLSVYTQMQADWSLNTIEVYATLFDIIMSISNEYIEKYCVENFLENMLDPEQEFPPPLFYIIPKLHKNPISSRPITPSYAWVTSDVSKYLAQKWSTLLTKCDYILPNSLKLVKELEAINKSKKLPVTANLYTWDIKDMYTNIDLDDLCVRIKEMLIYLRVRPEVAEFQVKLLKWVNDNAYVKYQNNWYKQIKGLAMGSAVAPVAANLYMAKVLIDSFGEPNNMFWDSIIIIRSYIDDIFAVLAEGFSLDLIGNRISATAIPSYFELDGTTANKVSFLDLNLEMCLCLTSVYNAYGVISISPYDKPTNIHAYTDTESYYPYNYRYSWIQGENIRLIRNSDNSNFYDKALYEFKHFLQNRRYPIVEINKHLTINNYSDREELLKVKDFKNDYISHIDFILPINNSPSRDVVIKLFKKVFKLYNYNASVHSNRTLRVAFPVRKGTAVIDILNKAKKK
ncbi:8507_t:CDS:2, partial [Dentiscutata erythropus]